MRNFWILLKVNLVNNLKLNKLKRRFARNRFTQIFFPVLTVIMALIIIALICFYLFMFYGMFIAVGEYKGMLTFGLTVSALIVFITTISIANSYLFISKDYDLLMSLPIKSHTIIASKFTSLLMVNYLLFALTYVPTIIIYGIMMVPNVFFYLLSLIIFLVGPLLVITIASAISYFVELLFARFKHRNLIQITAMLLLFLSFMFLYFKFAFGFIPDDTTQDELELIRSSVNNLVKVMQAIYYPGKWAVAGLNGDFLAFTIYLLASIAPFALFIYIVGTNFSKTVARTKLTYTNKNFKLQEQKVTSETGALLKREFKMFFSNASVVLNIITGPIMGTLVLVFFVFNLTNIGLDQLNIDNSIKTLIAIGIIVFMNGIISTTGSSISLEGKTLWIIKSAPLSANTIFKAKVLFNLLLALPFIIINTVVAGIFITQSVIDLFMILFIPIIYNLLEGAYGLYINLCFPKLDWDNPIKVVKQSLSTFIIVFSSMIFTIGIFFLAYLLYNLGLIPMYLLMTLILIVIFILLVLLLRTDGAKKFMRLKA